MGTRVQFQTLLEVLLGSRNVYFQPPETIKLSYPCIIYSRVAADSKYADNIPYTYQTQYQVMVIDANPDGGINSKVAVLPMCKFDRHYKSNNLNHDIFRIYY